MRKSAIYSYSKSELQEIVDASVGYTDILKKIGMSPKGGNPKTLKRIIAEYNIDTSKLDSNRRALYSKCAYGTHRKTRVDVEDIINGKVSWQGSARLLRKLIKSGYKESKCEVCGITEWQGKPISMCLHHIDGNHDNNSIDNLQVLCPNCHSQTDNYAGKKLKKQ